MSDDNSTESSLGEYLDEMASGQPSANDAEEVTEDGIEFIEDKDFYVTAAQVFECPDCGSDCSMGCRHDGNTEVAYCEECEYEFTRRRQNLVGDISSPLGLDVEEEASERDVYQEYDCPACDERHPYSKPRTDYSRQRGQFVAMRTEHIPLILCPCGARLSLRNTTVYDEIDCSSCSRTYDVSITEE